MKTIWIKVSDEVNQKLTEILWEWFTWKDITNYILNATIPWCKDGELEEVIAKYEALKKTQTRLQDIVGGIDDIKKMLQQWTPKVIAWGANVFAWWGSIYSNLLL